MRVNNKSFLGGVYVAQIRVDLSSRFLEFSLIYWGWGEFSGPLNLHVV